MRQAIDAKGYQQELPDIWLSNGNPWEIARPEITYKVGFYGTVDNFKWSPGEQVRSPNALYKVFSMVSELGAHPRQDVDGLAEGSATWVWLAPGDCQGV